MKKKITASLACLSLFSIMQAQTNVTGPSSSQSPYVQAGIANSTITSIFTVPDVVSGYTMCGVPDGLGAFDNNDGTFTLLMNHEMGSAVTGSVRAHGSSGAFVSKWKINKSTLQVVNISDLIQNVKLWNGTSYTTYNAANSSTLAGFGRFCSADLAHEYAFYNKFTGVGTLSRIFLNGEETGNEGRMMAHIVTGPEAGTSYELPYLGKFSAENLVACPYSGNKTVVGGMDDSTPGQVYFYIGQKSNGGNEIQKAGLTGGKLYGVGVTGVVAETNLLNISANTTFTLIDLGQVNAITGASLNTMSNNMGVTTFLRPEDGAWDPSSPNDFYFATTNAVGSPSRLWKLHFTNMQNPELGGTITAVLDGPEGGHEMFDNITIDHSGHILLVEDVGNNSILGRVWQYDIDTDVLTLIATHDSNRFLTGAANFLTQDEEASGILDVQSILGPGMFLFDDQAHYGVPSPAVEGGQLLAMYNPLTATTNPEINLQGNAINIPTGNTAISSNDNTNMGGVDIYGNIQKTFVIQNTGAGALKVGNIVMSGANAGDFTLVNPPVYPLSIAASSSYTITIKFYASLSGTKNATVNIVSNDYSETFYDFSIQAKGLISEINVQGNGNNILSGTNITNTSNNSNFGTQQVNMASSKSFVIQNTGDGSLSVSSISISGTNASEFTLQGTSSFPFIVVAGASQTINVQFLPTAAGARSANIAINSNDLDEGNYTYRLQGEGAIDTGIESLSNESSNVTVYPNPTKDEATVKFSLNDSENVSIKMFDIQGKLVSIVAEKNLDKGEHHILINTSSLKNGNYFVKVSSNNKITTVKMVVTR